MQHDDGFTPLVVRVGDATVTVREAGADDVDRLVELYQRLTPADLHRRFFSGFRPQHSFLANWIDREKGGVVLIAVEGEPATGRIVADAGYVPVGTDIAEFAITVDPDRRGWLGPYLLDVLVEHARHHGIVDLVAEVLTNNCGMLAVLRSRGCAFEPSDDPAVARVLIGTEGHVPVWPKDSPHPRVLVEGSTGSWPGAQSASDAGMSVLVCPGPERGRMHPCPLLDEHRCPLVDEADAVVVALPRSAPATGPLIDAHEHLEGAEHQPIALSGSLREIYGDIPGRPTWVIDPGSTGEEAIAAMREALEDQDGERDST